MTDVRKGEYAVPYDLADSRLDVVMDSLVSGLTRSQAARLIKEERVAVFDAGGRLHLKPKAGFSLSGGERILIEFPPVEDPSIEPEDIPLDIRYEDDHLIVVNKPVGLVVHPAPGHPSGTLVNALAAHSRNLSDAGGKFRPGIVHRLDRDTSGLLIVARNNEAHRALASQLADRTLSREYRAIVWGCPIPAEGRIEASIGRHLNNGKLMAVDGRASRTAATSYLVIEDFGYVSHLSVKLETGRTHQIRVHFQHIGHPVFGDPQYGGREKAVSGVHPRHRVVAAALLAGMPRQALHAYRLRFVHPVSGEMMDISAEPPEDFDKLLHALSGVANA